MAYFCVKCGTIINNHKKKYCPKCKKEKELEWQRNAKIKRQETYKLSGPIGSVLDDTSTEKNSAYIAIWKKKLTMGQCTRQEYEHIVKSSLPRINGKIYDEEAAVGLSTIMIKVKV